MNETETVELKVRRVLETRAEAGEDSNWNLKFH